MTPRLWMHHIGTPLVVAAMVGLVALTIRSAGQMFFPAWDGTYFVVLAVLVSLEASYSHRLLRPVYSGDDRRKFRLVEIGLIFLLVRFGKLLSLGGDLSTELAQFVGNPLLIGLDAETILVFILVLIGWDASSSTVHELDQLSDRADLPPRSTAAFQDGKLVVDDSTPTVILTEEQTVRARLVRRFFMGGIFALLSAGLARIGISELLNLERPPIPGLVLTVLTYFLMGLLLVGVIQFASLRKQWRATGVQVRHDLPQRWVRYTVIFVSLATFIAFLLPTSYAIGPLQALRLGVDFLSAILTFIGLLLFFLVMMPLAWILSKLSSPMSAVPPIAPPVPPQLNLPTTTPAEIPPWIDVVRSLFFWALILVIIVYVIRTYLRDHPELQRALASLAPIRFLRRGWAMLRSTLASWATTAARLLPSTQTLQERFKAVPVRPFRRPRLGARTPREQVLYYYRSLLHRTDQQGFPRHPSETPYEYDRTLETRLPEAEPDLDDLARAFVEARYSQHPIESDDARRVRAEWERVKAALQEQRRQASEKPGKVN